MVNKSPEPIEWDEPEEVFVRRSQQEIVDILGADKLKPKIISPWLVVKLQSALTILFTILSVLGSNPVGMNSYAISFLAGGIVGIVPTAIFATRLTLANRRQSSNAGGYVVALVSGEFIKIVTTVALVAAIAWNIPNLMWLPMLVMYVLTLKCYWLAWFLKK